MTETEHQILAVVLESHAYETITGVHIGRTLVVHYVKTDGDVDYEIYGYPGSKYARRADLPPVKIKFSNLKSAQLIKSYDGSPDTLIINNEAWERIQVSNVTLH